MTDNFLIKTILSSKQKEISKALKTHKKDQQPTIHDDKINSRHKALPVHILC